MVKDPKDKEGLNYTKVGPIKKKDGFIKENHKYNYHYLRETQTYFLDRNFFFGFW